MLTDTKKNYKNIERWAWKRCHLLTKPDINTELRYICFRRFISSDHKIAKIDILVYIYL